MKKIITTIIALALLIPSIGSALSTYLPVNGGTGSAAIPTYGQVLVGTGTGVYAPMSTSSLGISAGGSQTPWTSNIDGATYNLNNAGKVGVGTSTPVYAVDIFGASAAKGLSLTSLSTFSPYITLKSAAYKSSLRQTATSLQIGSGDPDTYSPLFIITNNTNRVAVNSTAPLSQFEVGGNMAVGSYAGSNAAPANGLIVSGNVGIGTTTPSSALQVMGTTTATAIELNGTNTGIKFADGTYQYTASTGGGGTSNWSTTSSNYWGSTYTGALTAGTISVPDYLTFDGSYNTNVGVNAGKNLAAGASWNTYLGGEAGFSSTTGSTGGADYNIGIGYLNMNVNATGNNNASVGNYALSSNESGSYNTAYGNSALSLNTTGSYNTALGYQALANNKTGANNVAIGHGSLQTILGSNNIGIGYYAGKYETGSNTLYVDNRERNSLVESQTRAMFYGNFAALPANQQLTVNAHLTVTGSTTLSNSTTTLGTVTTLWSTLANIATGIFSSLTTNGTASSTSLVVSDSSITVGGKKMYSADLWSDRMSIPTATTTDETFKFGSCLRQGGPSVTINSIETLIASTSGNATYSTSKMGIAWNLNIAANSNTTSPMTAFTASQYSVGTTTIQVFTPNNTTIIPSGYCYWFSPSVASSTQIQQFYFNIRGTQN